MHATTAAVRALYERFPYPAGPITLRIGFDVRRALSFVHAEREPGRPLQVLDAGCGRGSGVLGMAMAQPDIQFLGIDLNRAALREAKQQATARGLKNVRFAEVDLETLAGLEGPQGGFDLIVSSGVVHHLVDPCAGLARLREHLAPWGVLDLMVYAQAGRVGIERVAQEIDHHVADGPIDERLAAARRLVSANPFDPDHAEAASLDDVEFVDRYLHPQFVSYCLDDLKGLIDGAGLDALRWTNASAWGPAEQGGANANDPWTLASDNEAKVRPRMYDMLLTNPGLSGRSLPAGEAVDRAGWALNGEGQLQQGTRTLWTGQRQTAVTWSHPSRPTLPLEHGPAAAAAGFLTSIDRPFRGHELLHHLEKQRVSRDVGRQLLRALASLDVLWCPHEVDLAQHRAVPLAA